MQLTSPITTSRTSSSTTPQIQVMKEGQVVYGKVVKLHPNQMAEVSIGKERMFARLEVPMKAGAGHYFQVTSVSPELNLRVVSEAIEGKQTMGERVQALIQALKLPQTKEMTAILRQLMKQEVPATREQLLAAERLMQQVPKSEWLQATKVIQQMVTFDRPMTPSVFQALMSVSAKEPMIQNLQQLAQAVMNDPNISSENKAKIMQQIEQIQRPFQQFTTRQLGAQLFQQLSGSQGPQPMQQAAQQLMQAIQSGGENKVPQQLLQLLQSIAQQSGERSASANQSTSVSAQPPTNAQASASTQVSTDAQTSQSTQAIAGSLSPKANQLLQQLMQQPLHPMPMRQSEAIDLQKLNQVMQNVLGQRMTLDKQTVLQELTSLTKLPSLQQSTKSAIQSLVQQVAQDQLPLKDVKVALTRLLLQQGIQQQMTQPLQEPTTEQRATFLRLAPQLEQLVQQMQQQSPETLERLERPLMQQVSGQKVHQVLQQMIRQLGFHFEHQLTTSESSKASLMDTLKPQLLQLLQEPTTSLQVRQQAEAMLVRLNAPMISAVEQNGQQQLMMQVPLEIFGKQLDTTLHWEGQTTEDGKIDAKFARVLFYLQLETLDETVIDMQVQNNIVTITVFNDTPRLEFLSKPLEESLKEGLHKNNYRLSGLVFKPLEAQYHQPKKRTAIQPLSSYSTGVDYRI